MKKTKTWDRTAYAKTGWRNPNKGENKEFNSDGEQVDQEEEEQVEFEFPQATDLGELFPFPILSAGEPDDSPTAVGYGFHPCSEPINILTYG